MPSNERIQQRVRARENRINESASVVRNTGRGQGNRSIAGNQNRQRSNKKENKPTNTKESSTDYNPKRHLRKINGGRVLQYPIDIDINLQDYFEMQVFRYRAAGRLASINDSTEEQLGSDSEMAGYNRRYNRQNLRLEELQSTIQIPIPNSVKDINAVGWGEDNLNPILGTFGGPVLERVFGQGSGEGVIGDSVSSLDKIQQNITSAFGGNTGSVQFRRRAALGGIAAATAGLTGVNIDFNSAITRINGTIINQIWNYYSVALH